MYFSKNKNQRMFNTNKVSHNFNPLDRTEWELAKVQSEGGEAQGLLEQRPFKKKLKVACVAVCAMGHFIPMQNVATSLKDAGHDVTIITNGNDQMKAKTSSFGEKYDITMAYTECGLTVEDALRPPRNAFEDPINTFMSDWLPHVRKTMKQVAPDIVVCDF